LADSPGPNARYHQDELNSHPFTARIVAVGETSDQTPRLALPSCVFSISFPGDPMEVTRPSLTGSTLTPPHLRRRRCHSAAAAAGSSSRLVKWGTSGRTVGTGVRAGLVCRPVPSPAVSRLPVECPTVSRPARGCEQVTDRFVSV